MWRGFDENLEQGARVCRQDFAAKLPTAPHFTVCASHLENLRPREGFDKLSPNGVGLTGAGFFKDHAEALSG
jgi:hypothetical protein